MLIATKNNMGFMSTAIDPVCGKFINKHAKTAGKILDIGAAYGVTTFPFLEVGCSVTAVDMEAKHLEELQENAPNSGLLTTITAKFPDELNFPDDTFDAIIISRVLHFLEGELIIAGLKKIKRWLKPEAELFILTETPFIKTLGRLRKEFLERKVAGEKWPGSFNDFPSYEEPHLGNLPYYINLQDQDTLSAALLESGLKIQEITYVSRSDFPEHMLLDGRESIAAIATK